MKYIIESLGVVDSLPIGLKVSSEGHIVAFHHQVGVLCVYHKVGYALEDWEYEAIDSSIYLIGEKLGQISDYLIKYRFGDIHLEYSNEGFSKSLRLSTKRLWNLESKYDNTNFYCTGGYTMIEALMNEIDAFVEEINTFVKSTTVKRRVHLGGGYYNYEVWNIPLLTIK